MPSHTDEERQRKRKAPKRGRTTGGNQTADRLRSTFRTTRDATRAAANRVGQVGRAAISETAGVVNQAARGLAGQGPSPAAVEGTAPQATSAQQTAKRLGERARRAFGRQPAAPAGGGNLGGGFTRAEAQQRFDAGQRGSRPARIAGRVGRFARGLALPATGLAIGAEALGTPQAQLEAQSGLPEVRPLIGEQPGGQAPGAQAPVNLERFGDPLLAAARPVVGAVRGAFGAGATPPAVAEQVPVQQQQPTGLREFGNVDIGGGAVSRGTASVEENLGVAQRLADRGAALRAAGAQTQPGQADSTATRLAGGGLASAFGALALSGNQLRREAADRGRAFTAGRAQQDAQNKLTSELTKIGAKSQVDRQKDFAKDAVSFTESVNDAIATGDPEQVANIRSSVFEAAAKDPEGPASAAAANLVAEDIRNNTQSGFFGALFNPFDAFFKGERGPLDAIASLGQGGFNNEFQSAIDKLTLNESTGQLEIANPDGSGGTQEVAAFTSLSPETREFLSQRGLRKIGAGQQVTRGDPNRQDPNRPSLRSGL